MNQSTNEKSMPMLRDFLPWLLETGADEILLDEPVNRFLPEVAGAGQRTPPAASEASPRSVAAIGPTSADRIGNRALLAQECTTLDALMRAVAALDDHPLKKTATQTCFLGGASQSGILVIADKPRNEEDSSGEVLAGRNQVLAERMLAAIGLSGVAPKEGAEQVMLASFLPWRPPGNRQPTEAEARMVLPFVQQLVALVKPKAILGLGAMAGQFLAGGEEAVVRARGKWLTVDVPGHRAPLMTTFHPDTLLKSPQSKRLAWQDLLEFRRRLNGAN